MTTVKKLWNKNFLILWQGQFISDFGNAAFSVALGFWVLEVTRSTALMGAILACFALPRVLIGPFAGALADRLSRKWIIVLADLTRGVLFSLMGATVFLNVFPFSAIYPIAILAGICDGFFGPAISSSIPDLVPMEDLTKANSARSLSATMMQLVGNSLGGLLFAWLKAPLMILVNGLSFLYAAATQLFMKIPVVAPSVRKHILHDMGDGMKYTFSNRGIRSLLIMCLITNYFALVGITLLTPLFESTPGFGVERYGFVMGAMMAGAVIGMLALSAVKIKPASRARIFFIALIVEVFVIIPIGIVMDVNFMYPLAFVAGVCNAIVNVMIQTIMQATTPPENRGKVFGILGTVSGALMPLAMASSGVIAAFAGVRPTIIGSFVALLLGTLPLLFDRHFKEFINTDIASAAPTQAEEAAPAPEEPAAAPAPEEI